MVLSALEYPKNIRDIGHHVGNQKGKEVTNHRVSRPGGIRYFADGEVEIFYRMIFVLKRWKEFPGNKMENNDMRYGGQASGKGIFYELNNRCVVNSHKWDGYVSGVVSTCPVFCIIKVVLYTRLLLEKPEQN